MNFFEKRYVDNLLDKRYEGTLDREEVLQLQSICAESEEVASLLQTDAILKSTLAELALPLESSESADQRVFRMVMVERGRNKLRYWAPAYAAAAAAFLMVIGGIQVSQNADESSQVNAASSAKLEKRENQISPKVSPSLVR